MSRRLTRTPRTGPPRGRSGRHGAWPRPRAWRSWSGRAWQPLWMRCGWGGERKVRDGVECVRVATLGTRRKNAISVRFAIRQKPLDKATRLVSSSSVRYSHLSPTSSPHPPQQPTTMAAVAARTVVFTPVAAAQVGATRVQKSFVGSAKPFQATRVSCNARKTVVTMAADRSVWWIVESTQGGLRQACFRSTQTQRFISRAVPQTGQTLPAYSKALTWQKG
eukprot:8347441-Pyramimonas_sp.AAC.1